MPRLNIGIVVWAFGFALARSHDVGERVHPPEGGYDNPLYRDELRLVTDERASSTASEA